MDAWLGWAAEHRRAVGASRVAEPNAALRPGDDLFNRFVSRAERLAGTAAAATARERAVWDRLQEQAFVAGTLGTIGGAGLLLVGSLVLWLALRRVSRLAEAAHLLAAGPEAAIPYGSRRDDVGAVARALMSWRQAEASGRALWRHVPVGMLTYSLRMEIRASNPAIASMFGYGYEDWIRSDPGTRVAARNSHPDDLKATRALYRRLLVGESEHETLEKRFIRRDGSVF